MPFKDKAPYLKAYENWKAELNLKLNNK